MRVMALLMTLFMTAAQANPPADSFRAYIDGRWGQIHVRVMGPANGPAIILVHKMVWSSTEFANAQPLLASRGIRSIAVDLPGYGLSDGPATQPTADDYADDLLPVLDHFKLTRAVMLGTNTGATIVTAFALRHTDRTRALVLDGPPIFKGATLAKLLAEPEIDRSARPNGAELVEFWRQIKTLGKPGDISDDTAQKAVLQFFQAGPHYLFGHHAIFTYDLESALDHVTVPVLIITSPGDQMRAVDFALKAAHPSFTLKDLPWDHMVADVQAPAAWSGAAADYVLTGK